MRRALIVDDSRVLRMHLRGLMQELGWKCEEAETAYVALDKMTAGGDFGLTLLDQNMPGMSGLECLRTLRKMDRFDPMKVLMVTTESEFSLIEDALGNGADEFLMKPFTRESLKTKLMLMGFGVEREPICETA